MKFGVVNLHLKSFQRLFSELIYSYPFGNCTLLKCYGCKKSYCINHFKISPFIHFFYKNSFIENILSKEATDKIVAIYIE